MTDPWADVRELIGDAPKSDMGPRKMTRSLLTDADALWSGNREARAQIVHLIAWLASDLSALNRRELVEAVDRIAGDALAALPEGLK